MQTIRLIVLIQDAFSRMLDEANWLDEGTKSSTKDKLHNMNLKIGYPDYIIDDEALDRDYDQVLYSIMIPFIRYFSIQRPLVISVSNNPPPFLWRKFKAKLLLFR